MNDLRIFERLGLRVFLAFTGGVLVLTVLAIAVVLLWAPTVAVNDDTGRRLGRHPPHRPRRR